MRRWVQFLKRLVVWPLRSARAQGGGDFGIWFAAEVAPSAELPGDEEWSPLQFLLFNSVGDDDSGSFGLSPFGLSGSTDVDATVTAQLFSPPCFCHQD